MASTLKTALVTGAGSGIGRSITATLTEMGLRVALLGRDREKLERSRAELTSGRDSAFVAACDISDRFAVKAVVNQILTAFEGIDVLVCNAGTNVKNRSLESLEPADWDRMIATNLTGSFNLVHSVLPSMRAETERAGHPDLLGVGPACEHSGRCWLLRFEIRPVGPRHLPGP